jgi:hypothetical protein
LELESPERGVHARAKVCEFLDKNPVLGSSKIDKSAASLAGHIVFQDEPSDSPWRVLSATRAADFKIGAFSGGERHNKIPPLARNYLLNLNNSLVLAHQTSL